MPKLITPDGTELDDAAVQQQFAEAMAAPEPDEPLAAAPQRKEDQAAPQASPKEPAAATADGKARTRRTAAPAADRKRRSRAAAPASSSAPAKGTYREPIGELLDSLTILGVLTPVPDGAMAVRIRLQAALVDQHKEGLATALDLAACNNSIIRRGVESLTMGASGWMLPAVLAVVPFAMQSQALWREPVTTDMVDIAKTFESNIRAALTQGGRGESAAA